MLKEDEPEFTVQVYVSKAVNTPVACAGIVLNLITFYVWSGVRRVTLLTYMFKILAAVDTSLLLVYLVWLYYTFSKDIKYMYELTRWEDVILMTSLVSSTYMVVFMTTCIFLTGYVKVFYPTWSQKVETIKGFKIAFVAYCFFSFILNGSKFMTQKFTPVEKRWLVDRNFTIPTYTLFLFLPSLVQAVLITQLLLGVNRATSVVLPSGMIENQTGTAPLNNPLSSQPKEPAEHKENQKNFEHQREDPNILDVFISDDLLEFQAKLLQRQTERKARHRQLKCTLAGIVLVSFVSYGVMPVLVMLFSFIRELSPYKWNIYAVKHCINILNSSLNFFFYYSYVDEFRCLFNDRMPQLTATISWVFSDQRATISRREHS